MPFTENFQPASVTPLIKWAGGKRGLLHDIQATAPKKFTRYFEPFLGGGAVFFSVSRDKERFVNDFNAELIAMYEVVRDTPQELIAELQELNSDKDTFLAIRALDRNPSYMATTTRLQRAARFIYLNKTCFNGMHRVNSRGEFNVPYAGKETTSYKNAEQILNASSLLNERSIASGERLVSLFSGSFDDFLNALVPGEDDWVYLDPPYAPISATSNFVSYERNTFGENEQRSVFEAMVRIEKAGGKVLLSNSNAQQITSLVEEFRPNFRHLNVREIDVRRSISAKASSRGKVKELLISNYVPGK